MRYLPTSEERDWLVSRLAELIASQGRAQFIEMPILQPTRQFFPDPWTFSHEGLDRLVRRLMQYAGLGDLDIKIGTYVEFESLRSTPTQDEERSIAGLFMGIAEGRCLFAFNEHAPADAEYMAGVMCHEVAHAYRAHHGLVSSKSVEEEECITDVTAVYLGFGILAANNSFRYRTAGWIDGALSYHSWSAQSTGYLTPQAFAFLLAIQMAARDLSSAERRHILKRLETDQAAFTKSALEAVWDNQPDIMEALQLKPGAGSDVPKRLEEVLRPLPEYAAPEPGTIVNSGNEPERFNLGRPVFRVPANRAHWHGLIGLFAGILLGVTIAVFVQIPLVAFLATLLGAVIGLVHGYRSRFEVCSDPECETVLGDDPTCPKCGGFIAGSIRHAEERFDAAKKWKQKMKQQHATKPEALKVRRMRSDKTDPAL
jgi:hypothetical protein